MTHTVVIGGGISGLTAAYEVVSRGGSATLIEGSPRLGGEIDTQPFGGIDLDTGPDSFLARVPAAVDLAREVGLGDSLVAPGTGQAWLWTRGALRPLPSGLVLGVPTSPRALWGFSRLAAARAALDLVLPGRPVEGDVSVGILVRRRMGRSVQLGLVDPLIGGINAGHTDELSAAVVAPQLLAAAQSDRSLMRGLRRLPAPATPGPVFLTVKGGMARLVAALRTHIGDSIQLGDPVQALARDSDRWAVRLRSGALVPADAVVVACPAPAAAALLKTLSPAASSGLSGIRTVSVVVTTLQYRGVGTPTGSGFLVPRTEGRLMTACSWVGPKWPHLDTPGDLLMRVSAGRSDDTRALSLDDAELVAALHRELSSAMDLSTPPIEARVHRWDGAFPQYEVGHLDRIAAVEAALRRDAPGVYLAGAAMRGVGLATCIAGARAAGAAAASA
jgi:oxygen-dependent protoporphyrinogen oxidase